MYISNHCSHWQWLISYVAISAPEQTVFWRRRGDFWSFTVPHFSFPPCVNLLKRVCIKIEEEKNRIHKDGERDQSYLVGDSFVFRYKRGSRRRTRWGDSSSSCGAVRTFVNVHENVVDIISIVVSRPAEYCGRAQDEIPVRGGPTPQQQDTAKLIHRVLLEYLIKLMKDHWKHFKVLRCEKNRCFSD